MQSQNKLQLKRSLSFKCSWNKR